MARSGIGGGTLRRAPLRPRSAAEQTMPMPASARHWTADEVRAMQSDSPAWPRYELIDGELLVTPAPRPIHQRAVFLLARLLAEYVENGGLGEVWTSPADIELESGSIVQPDVFVVPRSPSLPVASWRELDVLTLAAEVSSPSTARWDRVTKRRFFGRKRVDQYWVVDLDARVIEGTVPGDPKVELSDTQLEWFPTGASVPFTLDLEWFFTRVHGEP